MLLKSFANRLGAMVLVGLTCLAAPGSPATAECRLVELSDSILWPKPGVWATNDTLLLPDVTRQALMEVETPTGLARRQELENGGRKVTPSKLRRLANGKIEMVHSSYSECSTLTQTNSGSWQLLEGPEAIAATDSVLQVAVWDSIRFKGGTLAFADYEVTEKKWGSGLVFIGPAGEETLAPVTILDSWPARSFPADFYLRSEQFMTELDGVAYVLKVSNGRFEIGRWVGPGSRYQALPHFPMSVDRVPYLPRYNRLLSLGKGAEVARRHYEAFEDTEMPVSLVSWDHRLFLLWKSAADQRGYSRWSLIEVNPDTGAEEGVADLGFLAGHVLIVPGETWAFVLRDPVVPLNPDGAPLMKSRNVVLIPFRDISSGLARSQEDSLRICE